ncbi:MAG: exodeoxyribonuclease VII small subunit [Clostridiales bacterium]|nr:exodeoxyribonuclease VII small subunit [Clostridiales bacterium]
MDIEQKLNELNELTQRMESGVSLEDGLKLFEQGVRITKECMAQLQEYKGKLNQIKADMDTLLDE